MKPSTVFTVSTLAASLLTLAGCTSPPSETSGPAAGAPRPDGTHTAARKSKSPYTREYYQTLAVAPVGDLQKKVRVGMSRTELTDVLGRQSSMSMSTNGSGSLEFARNDGTLVVKIEHDKVAGTQIRPRGAGGSGGSGGSAGR